MDTQRQIIEWFLFVFCFFSRYCFCFLENGVGEKALHINCQKVVSVFRCVSLFLVLIE
jgi:hypothetical protein